MSPSLEFLDSFYEKQQANAPKYLQDVFCGYSIGDSECKTCPTIPACPKRKATKRHKPTSSIFKNKRDDKNDNN